MKEKKIISCIYLFLEATLPLPTYVFKPHLYLLREKDGNRVLFFLTVSLKGSEQIFALMAIVLWHLRNSCVQSCKYRSLDVHREPKKSAGKVVFAQSILAAGSCILYCCTVQSHTVSVPRQYLTAIQHPSADIL